MPNKNSTFTYRWMEEVWNSGREDAIDEMLDENAAVHGIEGITEKGPAGFKVFYNSFREQFPQVHVEVDDVVTEQTQDGTLETSRCTVTGTHSTGKKVNFTGMTCIYIKDDKISEAWNSFDFKSMFEQLGFKMTMGEEVRT